MPLNIQTREADGVTVVELAGRLALGPEAAALKAEVQKLLAAKKTCLLLDVEKIIYLDSTGAGALVRCFMTTKAAGGALKLLRPSARLRELLKVTNLAQILDVFDDEAAALASFR